MMRRVAALLASTGMLLAATVPASAAKVVALIAGNTSESGVDGVELNRRLVEIMGRLVGHGNGDDEHIVQALDVSRDELKSRIATFQGKLSGADFALVYYVGPGAYDTKSGTTYLIPKGAGRAAADLVPLASLIERMKTDVAGKSLVVIDALRPQGSWGSGDLRPGLGSLDRETSTNRLMIAYNSTPTGAKQDGMLMAESLMKRLNKPVKLQQLAALMQEDVSYESSGAVVPRVSGGVQTQLEFQPITSGDVHERAKRCVAAAEASGVLRASAGESGSRSMHPFFCTPALTPEQPKPAAKPKPPEEKEKPAAKKPKDNEEKQPVARHPAPEPRQAQREPPPKPSGGSSGGGSGGRGAVSQSGL